MKYSTGFKVASIIPIIPLLISSQGTDPYLDPGTGSMVLQVGIGFLFGGLLALQIFWNRISIFFKNLFSREKKLEETK